MLFFWQYQEIMVLNCFGIKKLIDIYSFILKIFILDANVIAYGLNRLIL